MKKRNRFQIFKLNKNSPDRSPTTEMWGKLGSAVFVFASVWAFTMAVSMVIFAFKFIQWVLTW